MFSPFFILFKQECRLPIDTALRSNDLPVSAQPCMEEIIENAELIKTLVNDNILQAQQRYKSQYDQKSTSPHYQEGQQVLVQCSHKVPGISAKLQQKYEGPYYVTKILPNDVYLLRHCRTNKQVKSPVNAMRLRPYFSPEDRPTNPPGALVQEVDPLLLVPKEAEDSSDKEAEDSSDKEAEDSSDKEEEDSSDKEEEDSSDKEEGTPGHSEHNTPTPTPLPPSPQSVQSQSHSPSSEDESDEETYFVEKILACKAINKVKHYKIKWLGHSTTTWEPESHVPDHLIRDFHVHKTCAGRSRRKGK